MKPKILCIGSMNMDLIIYDIERLPKLGESIKGNNYVFSPGGKGGNQSIAVTKLGGECHMLGVVGNDLFGNQLIINLKKIGVETDYVKQNSEAQTGLATIMVNQDADYLSYMVMGGNDHITTAQVRDALEDNEFDMILIQLEMPLEVVYESFELAKKKDIPVFLDAGPAMNIPLERFKDIFVISPNEAECFALTGVTVDSFETALAASKIIYSKCTPKFVILKLGKQGSFVFDGEVGKMYPAFNVDAIDSTAAGDTFGAGFAVSQCLGDSIDKSIEFAQASAGLCVSKKGAQESIPDRKQVLSFLDKNIKKGI